MQMKKPGWTAPISGCLAIATLGWLAGSIASDEFDCGGDSTRYSNSIIERVENEEEEFHEALLAIAKEYKQYGRVDDETRWAPHLCRMPRAGTARFSESDDEDTHGQKLYYLFAKNRVEYITAKSADQPDGQVIVKQSWTAKEYTGDNEPSQLTHAKRDELSDEDKGNAKALFGWGSYFKYAKKNGKWFETDKQADLFIMMKTDESENTDEGWVYGVVTPDGESVKAAGKLESCMECHVEAEHDRVFGISYKD